MTVISTCVFNRTFDTLCHVIVEHDRHVLDVNASPGDVRGDEDVFAATLQHCQSKLALLLALTSVKSDGIVLYTHQAAVVVLTCIHSLVVHTRADAGI